MFYIFHGDDEFSRAEALADFKSRMGDDPAMADLNTTLLDGKKIGLGELTHACDTIPFMAQVRLIIVENLLARLTGKRPRGKKITVSQRDRDFLDALLDYLPRLPDTTRLAFVDDLTLSKTHPLIKLAESEKKGYVREFNLPDELRGGLGRGFKRGPKKRGAR